MLILRLSRNAGVLETRFGIDFAIIYPTSGLGLPQASDAACRRAACAAYNAYIAEFFGASYGVLHGRIPDRISDGTLEQRAQAKLSPADSHVMLCGNPGMIDGTVSVLQEREMTKHRRRRPGHISFEKYW